MSESLQTARHYISKGFKYFRIAMYYTYIPIVVLFGLQQRHLLMDSPMGQKVYFVPSLRDLFLPPLGPEPTEEDILSNLE